MISSKAFTTSILPFAPRPCPDEIISSWLSRVSCRYDLKPVSLLDRLDPRDGVSFSPKIDWNLPDHYRSCLAAAARLKEKVVARLDAARVHPKWADHWFAWYGFGRSSWTEADFYTYRLRWSWCVPCLAKGYALTGHDFIRLSWTLACVGYCHEHRLQLTDECSCGASDKPIHVPEGNKTRLICRFCERPISSYLSPDDLIPRPSLAIDLQIAFERDLVAALNGDKAIQVWCGTSSNAQLLAAVNDIARALCIRPAYYTEVLIEAFDDELSHRLPYLPNLDHVLCALTPAWRALTIGAVLAIIGRDDVRKAMLADLRLANNFSSKRHAKGYGSLEWMVDRLHSADVQRLARCSNRWPRKVRDRLRAADPGPYL